MRTKPSIHPAGLLFFLLVFLVAGCNVVAPFAYAIHGPGRVRPDFPLTPELSTVVFVDDPSSKATQRRMRLLIAEAATDEMMDRAFMKDMIDPRAIMAITSKERHSKPLSITELGQAVGADIVIYAALTEFTLSPDGVSHMPTCTLRVKIIDTREGGRVWPDFPEGTPVTIRPKHRTGPPPQRHSDRLAAETELAKKGGKAIGQLFYRHDITEHVAR